MILISLHAFFFLCICISNSHSHSHSHFYIRGHLLLLLSPDNLFTFLPFYFFTFKRPFTFKLRPDAAVATSRRNLSYVPTQPLLHRDAIFRTSRRSHRYAGTQFQMHREGVKNTENPGCNPERRTFRFVKYLSVVYGIVNFLPVCASTV